MTVCMQWPMMSAFSDGVWDFSVASTYIFLLSGRSNKAVGLVEGAQGLLYSISAVPAGWAADRFRRDTVLAYTGVVTAAAIAVTFAAVVAPDVQAVVAGREVHTSFVLLGLGFCLWGISMGMGMSGSEAILADSISTGQRSAVYAKLYSYTTIALGVGPLITAIVFQFIGNAWDLPSLQAIIALGMVLSIVPLVSLFFFDDDKTLGHESEALLESEQPDEEDALKEQVCQEYRYGLKLKYIPFIVCISDTVVGLGSGMTVKFMPVWFLEKVQLDPSALNLVMAALPAGIAAVSVAGPLICRVLGRVPTILAMRLASNVILLLLGLLPQLWPKHSLVIAMYLARAALANAPYPIERAIIMDYVPKSMRAKWSSLESVLGFGWSGSAVAGGFLLDSYGFQFTFVTTALLQAIGTLMLLPLLLLVPLHEQPPAKLAEARQPLLPGSAESIHTSPEAAFGAPAGLEGAGTAALSMPEPAGSPVSASRSPGTPPSDVTRGERGGTPGSLSGGPSPRLGSRRSSLHEPRRSFTLGSSPAV